MPAPLTPHPSPLAERHILSLIVDNEAGTLGRVVGVFSGRGYNIHSLTVSEVDAEKKLSRITITTHAPLRVIEQIIALLERLIPVHRVKDLTRVGPFVERGLILAKVHTTKENRDELRELAHQFHAREVDATDHSFVFELTDIPAKLNEFIECLKPYGLTELTRTGITALSRGAEGF